MTRARARAFSLIEMMLVIAITAVIAAVGVSTMSPTVDAAKLEGTAEALASFLAQAQAEAMASKRCTKVRKDGDLLVAERLNSFDCETATAPLIDGSKPIWINFATFRPDNSNVISLEFDPAPSETTAAALGNSEQDQIRFRPSGRLFSSDDVLTDDDGVIKVTHSGMSIGGTKKVLVEAQGLICDIPRGTDPSGTGNNLNCP